MHRTPTLVLAALALGACSTIPQDHPPLAQARSAYQTAASDPRVVELAPLELKQAEETLERAETLRREDAEVVRVDHQAYLARQRARIAQETAALRAAQNAVANADAARKQVLLEARTREAQEARERATAAQMRSEALEDQLESLVATLQSAQVYDTDRGYVLTLGTDVLFDFDESDLKPGAERAITQIAAFLREDPRRYVAIEGFTDSIGGEAYNRALSQRRARAVERALVARGIDASRVETRGYGEAYPVATNATAAGRQLNRRVEFVLADTGKPVDGRR